MIYIIRSVFYLYIQCIFKLHLFKKLFFFIGESIVLISTSALKLDMILAVNRGTRSNIIGIPLKIILVSNICFTYAKKPSVCHYKFLDWNLRRWLCDTTYLVSSDVLKSWSSEISRFKFHLKMKECFVQMLCTHASTNVNINGGCYRKNKG